MKSLNINDLQEIQGGGEAPWIIDAFATVLISPIIVGVLLFEAGRNSSLANCQCG